MFATYHSLPLLQSCSMWNSLMTGIATSVMHYLHTKKRARIHQLQLEEGARKAAEELEKCKEVYY